MERPPSGRKTSRPTVFTIGYEGRQLEDVVETLRRHCVKVLVDVRLTPISRRPGFSKSSLVAGLLDAGIEYRHEKTLGNPKDNRPGFRDGDLVARRRFGKHLQLHGADAVLRLRELVNQTPTALLCFESEQENCHRSAVAQELGVDVLAL